MRLTRRYRAPKSSSSRYVTPSPVGGNGDLLHRTLVNLTFGRRRGEGIRRENGAFKRLHYDGSQSCTPRAPMGTKELLPRSMRFKRNIQTEARALLLWLKPNLALVLPSACDPAKRSVTIPGPSLQTSLSPYPTPASSYGVHLTFSYPSTTPRTWRPGLPLCNALFCVLFIHV